MRGKGKEKAKEKPHITQCRFKEGCGDDGNKIKNPPNITGTRKKSMGK